MGHRRVIWSKCIFHWKGFSLSAPQWVGLRLKQQSRATSPCGWTNRSRWDYWIRSWEGEGSDEVQDYMWQQQSHHPALNSPVHLGSSSLSKYDPFPSVAEHRMVLPTATQLGRPHWEGAHSLSSRLSKSHLAGRDHNFDKIAVETAQTTKIH